jgi:hypothetical protein
MKSWVTALASRRCGYDSEHEIQQGEAYLEIDINGRKYIRCHQCAMRHQNPVEESTEPPSPIEPELEPEAAIDTEGEPW